MAWFLLSCNKTERERDMRLESLSSISGEKERFYKARETQFSVVLSCFLTEQGGRRTCGAGGEEVRQRDE